MKKAIGNEKVGKNEELYFHSISIFDIFSIFNSFCFRNNQIFLSPDILVFLGKSESKGEGEQLKLCMFLLGESKKGL